MLMSPPKFLEGFAFGERLPVIMFNLRALELPVERRGLLAHHFIGALTGKKGPGPAEFAGADGDFIEFFLGLVDHVQSLSNIPLLSRAKAVRRKDDVAECIVPTLLRSLAPLGRIIELLVQYIALPRGDPRRAALAKAGKQAFRQLNEGGLLQTNPARLLRAAMDENIPFLEISNTLTQYGIGKRSVLMDSTCTDRTSAIGAVLAKNKFSGGKVLRRMGLPVAPGREVANEQDALNVAGQLGYPVVVKPNDRDGGLGVAADLRTPEEVSAAYAIARKISPNVLVERFVPGRDYRLVVFHGRLVWAVEREPGGVTGDGTSTIAQLVEIANRDPNRGSGPLQPMKLLTLDDEARHLLARAGLDETSVLPANRFVRIRRAANVATGGRPVAVFDKVHPDNAALAIQAADAFRLDLAGIDLLLPDIAVSWQESGGAICEVNAQPQLGGVTSGHLYPQILKELVGGTGRVPVLAVMGTAQAKRLSASLAGIFSRGGTVGRHGPDGVWLGENRMLKGRVAILEAGRFLASQRSLDAMVLGIWDGAALRTGLPLPRIDILALSGEVIPLPKKMAGKSHAGFIARIFELIAPNCERIVLTTARENCAPELLDALEMAGCRYDVMDEAALAKALLPEPAPC
ncbi:MAG: acetate--CoA ligase family protein [Novosphingobium sp.]